MTNRVVFPFTAIVGQEKMKRALILNAVNPQIGGVLIRGERGTAKSTASRALAELLPSIEVVVNSRFNLAPGESVEGENADASKTELRTTPFVDLPVSATEDRVVGTLDIEKAIQTGKKHFEPGVLASANRGILYVDEVNLLDDHVVDLLLDSAAMGINVVEREGISFSHPAKFVLVGSMNPEEGDLRPQLLDRFAFCVNVTGLADTRSRVQVMERRLSFEVNPDEFNETWGSHEKLLSEQIATARNMVNSVTYTRRDLAAIATITSKYQVDGHRGDIVILRGAQAYAALNQRTRITDQDIIIAAELALPHRAHGRAMANADIAATDLENALDQVPDEFDSDDMDGGEQEVSDDSAENQKKKALDAEGEVADDADVSDTEAGPQSVPPAPQDGKWWEGGKKKEATAEFNARRLDTPLDKLTRRSSGRRSVTKTDRKRGRYIQSRLPKKDKVRDLAFDATIRAAAPYQKRRKAAEDNGMALRLTRSDLREKVRVKRSSNLIMFCVDASWSMAVSERMEATKGAIMSLLTDAYQRRDRVGLIVFHKNDARLVLSPTNSVLLAKKALKDVQVGGKTPLSAGLMLAHDVIKREGYIHPDVEPLMILLTDGAGNVSLGDRAPQDEAHTIANMFRDQRIRSLVINMEHPAFDQGLAKELAEQMDAPCHSLADLRAETLYKTVVDQLG